METSVLTYNDENSLECTIMLALFSARDYYLTVREFPAGKGFADARANHFDKTVLVVELKWDQSGQGAVAQIKNPAASNGASSL